MPQESYCPVCFARILLGAQTCPVCGADIAALSERDYRDKLLAALHHPLADVRLRAIIALGLRGEGEMAKALVQCALRHPADVVEGLEVVNSLRQIRDVTARNLALAELAERHPAHSVRAAAVGVLRGRGAEEPGEANKGSPC